jgi:hypothetical protein
MTKEKKSAPRKRPKAKRQPDLFVGEAAPSLAASPHVVFRVCLAPGCPKRRHQNSGLYCPAHRWRLKHYGALDAKTPRELHQENVRRVGSVMNRYRVVYCPGHSEATLVNNQGRPSGWGFEHRVVMANYLGRPLLKNENVHHRNGNRLDNRLENLELWVKPQPPGQRPSDLVRYAHSLLRLYAPVIVRQFQDEMRAERA